MTENNPTAVEELREGGLKKIYTVYSQNINTPSGKIVKMFDLYSYHNKEDAMKEARSRIDTDYIPSKLFVGMFESVLIA